MINKHYRVEPAKELINVEIHYASDESSWFAIGFSERGDVKPADYCILWIDWRRGVHFQVTKQFIIKQ